KDARHGRGRLSAAGFGRHGAQGRTPCRHLALSPDAKIKSSFQRPIKFTGKWKPTARGTLVLNEVIDLPQEELTVRVGVTSQALGKTGTTHVPLDVPNFRKTDLQLSSVVIGSAVQTIDAAIGLDILRTV